MSNPFSTRRIRPGVVEYLFVPEDQGGVHALADRLEQLGWSGAIVGPHGSGKTTLLHALAPELQRRGRTVQWATLRSGQRRLPWERAQQAGWDPSTQVIVDGFEQLSWWTRRRLAWQCRRRGAGLLVSVHRTSNLPTLVRTSPSEGLTRRIVRQLWPEHDRLIHDREIDACFQQSGGNVRETLFRLYDLYERRTR